MHCWREISKSLPIFLWGTLFFKHFNIFSRICCKLAILGHIFAPKGLDLSWMLLLYQIIITITVDNHCFKSHHYLTNQFTSLTSPKLLLSQLFLECVAGLNDRKGCIFNNTWSWPDKTWNILCSYCLQWNTSQSKFRNHYFLFLFAFSITVPTFLIWGCTNRLPKIHIVIFFTMYWRCYMCGFNCLSWFKCMLLWESKA